MGIEVRNATVDEFREALDVVSTAFLDRPDLDRLAAAARDNWIPARTWIARDGDATCGVWRCWPTELTLPGGATLPAGAVGPVTVLPTHRRRGVFRALTAAAHAGLRDLGDAVALLYSAEWPIYGRVGYGPATRKTDWTIRTVAAGGVHGSATGTIELLEPAAEKDVLVAIFEAWRTTHAGEVRRRDLTWEIDLGLSVVPWSGERFKGWVALHRSASGAPDGYARYGASSKEDGLLPGGVADVHDLVALDDAAYADLLRYLVGIDLVRTVELKGRPESDRARWLVRDQRAATTAPGSDALWVRLLDVARALAARSYEREGRVVLEVVDPEVEGGRERLLLDASVGGTSCTPTDAPADLTLPVAALGAAYLGGTRLRDITIATGVDEHTADAVARVDALLRTGDEPFCSTFF